MNFPEFAHSAFRAINECRADPPAYAEKLSQLSYNKNVLTLPSGRSIPTLEGPPALQDCVQALQRAPAVPPLQLFHGLCAAAQALSDSNRDKPVTGPNVDPSQSIDVHIRRYGSWKGIIGLNYAEGVGHGDDLVVQMLIDDGVPSRGHRDNILCGRFTGMGVGLASHKKKKYIGVIDLTETFLENIVTPPERISAALSAGERPRTAVKKAGAKVGAKVAGKPGVKKAGAVAGRKVH